MLGAVKKATKFVKQETVLIGTAFEKPAHIIYMVLVFIDAHTVHEYCEGIVMFTIIMSMFNAGGGDIT